MFGIESHAVTSSKADLLAAELSSGNSRLAAGDLAEAITHYRLAVAVDPTSDDAYLRLGYALKEFGRHVEARDALEASLRQHSANADAAYLLGMLEVESRNYAKAGEWLLRAVQLNPMIQAAYGNGAQALFRIGRLNDASKLIAKGVRFFPEDTHLLFFQGNLLAETGDYSGAAHTYRQALTLSEDNPAVLANLGNCERHLGNVTEAIRCLRLAISHEPDNAAWQSNLLFTLQYTESLSTDALFEEHRRFAERFEAPLKAGWPDHDSTVRGEGDRLRIGYVSGDFRDHALTYFFEPVLLHRDQTQTEVFCYYTYPVHDKVTTRLAEQADHWRDCAEMSDETMAAKIMTDRIDVLVDLSGHTGHNRLTVFARKPAPVQVTWLGYQATTGLSAMDYRITDGGIDPDKMAERRHSERLLRMSAGATFQPDPQSPEVNKLPVRDTGIFTFGCLNNPAKISTDFLDAAAHILLATTNSRVLFGNATLQSISMLRTAFAVRGVSADRLAFAERKSALDYLRLHHLIDLALDTFPYNGGTTTFHSLWMGVPVLALEGETSLSRVGAQMMRGMGLETFVSPDLDSYVEKAITFSSEYAFLQETRAALRGRMNKVMVARSSDFVEELERVFKHARDQVGFELGRGNGQSHGSLPPR